MIQTINPNNKRTIAEILERIYRPNFPINERIKKRFLNELLWSATEDNDDGSKWKYSGQPYWSVGALLKYLENKKNKKTPSDKDLRHERIVPRKIILELIEANTIKTSDSFYSILDNYAHAVVIEKSEHAGLHTKTFEEISSHRFVRYIDTTVKLCYPIEENDLRLLSDQNIENLIEKKKFRYPVLKSSANK